MDKFERFSKKWIKVLWLMNFCLCLLTMGEGTSPRLAAQFPVVVQGIHLTEIMVEPVSRVPAMADPVSVVSDSLTSDSADFINADGFTISPITPEIEARIRGRSYPDDCPIPLDSLCYLTVLHTGFDGLAHRGELIVNREIATITLEIFYRLYQLGYPIEKIILIDEYNADDEASMADNNTSAFCYRPIAGTDTLSLHSHGLAIDINPLYNPYVCGENVTPAISPYDNAAGAVPSPYFMTEADPCVQLFQAFGFTWGGSWDSPTDYQHFEYTITAIH